MEKRKYKIWKSIVIYAVTWFLLLGSILGFGSGILSGTTAAAAETKQMAALSDTSIIISKGETYALSVNGYYKRVSWRVQRESIAKVNSKGVVTGVKKGTTHIIAAIDGVEYQCKVYVEEPVLNKKKLRYRLGSSFTLKVSDTKRSVSFQSSNPAVVTVSDSGKLVFVGPGTAKVYAVIGKSRLSCSVTVPTPSITIPDLKLGETKEIDMAGKIYNRLSFSSNKPSVVQVSSDGKLTALKTGTAKITVKIADYTYKKTVRVTNDIYAAVSSGSTDGLSNSEARIAKRANQILNTVIKEDMTDIEKIRAVHDYIILNTAYDYENYLKDTLPDSSFEIEGVLFLHTAVCQGYAETINLFLNALGIENQLIYGSGWEENGKKWIPHVWNLICLEENWYHLDATWDDPLMDGKDIPGYVDYEYFFVTDDSIKDTHRWNASDYPAAAGGQYTDYATQQILDGYRREGRVLESISDYEDEVIRRFNEGEEEIILLYPEDGMPNMQSILQKLANEYKRNTRGDYKAGKIGNYTKLTLTIILQ